MIQFITSYVCVRLIVEPSYVYKDDIPGNETLACFDQINTASSLQNLQLLLFLGLYIVVIVHVWSFSTRVREGRYHYDVNPFSLRWFLKMTPVILSGPHRPLPARQLSLRRSTKQGTCVPYI